MVDDAFDAVPGLIPFACAAPPGCMFEIQGFGLKTKPGSFFEPGVEDLGFAVNCPKTDFVRVHCPA